MAVSKWPCLTFSTAMSCLDAKISLVPKHQLIVCPTLLAPATHNQTDEATKIHKLTPLTFELFFQNSYMYKTWTRYKMGTRNYRLSVKHGLGIKRGQWTVI